MTRASPGYQPLHHGAGKYKFLPLEFAIISVVLAALSGCWWPAGRWFERARPAGSGAASETSFLAHVGMLRHRRVLPILLEQGRAAGSRQAEGLRSITET